jgi:hypothetical protein
VEPEVNCKPGDLAIVVRSEADNEGKIVRCIRFVGRFNEDSVNTDYWLVDAELKFVRRLSGQFAGTRPYAPDSCLRPLRGLDEEEKTKVQEPQKETA